MNEEQEEALRECAEFLKDMVNAIDNGEPYSPQEVQDIGIPLLNILYESGIRLGGEI